MKKILAIGLCALLLVSLFSLLGNAGAQPPVSGGKGESELYLYLGSPLTLAGTTVEPLDSEHLSLVPVVYQNRTLVPLRAVSEHFGADVSYDAETACAWIGYNGKTARFPVGGNYFTCGSERYELDAATQTSDGRCLVPIRALSEIVLGKYVDYCDRIVSITDVPTDLSADPERMSLIREKIGAAVRPSSVEELRALVETGSRGYLLNTGAAAEADVKAVESPAAESAAGQTASAGEDYSATNVQVQGVDESDLVKTDGKFIYISRGDRVFIVRADGASLTGADVIKAPEGLTLSELYIGDGRLVVLGSRYDQIYPVAYDGPEAAVADERYMPYIPDSAFTYAGIYAVDETGKAALLKEVEVEGSLCSSRKKGDCLYLVSNRYIYSTDPGGIFPCVRDTAVSDRVVPLSLDSVLVLPGRVGSSYLNITAVDLSDPSVPSHTEAVLGAGDNVYMSGGNLYVAAYDYYDESGTAGTCVVKFRMDGLNFGYAASGKVRGTLLNQFSMDEYGGCFRVAATAWDNGKTENAVYVLDENLDTIGALEGLAEGERIYSVRFAGETGYVVTYRNMDPLFVLDLSDPSAPAVTGELELPGFSNYLHPLSDTLVLGVGYDTQQTYALDPDTGEYTVVGRRQGGIKGSLFDVSDPAKPAEIAHCILGDAGSYAEVQNNHKALMLDQEDRLFAFDAALTESLSSGERDYFRGAVVMAWDGSGFELKGRIPADGTGAEAAYWYDTNRLCYIGDVLYYVQGGVIRAFGLSTLSSLGRFTLG
jgi:uncharacterized secreted protein with C-terminal beta-propeller domain